MAKSFRTSLVASLLAATCLLAGCAHHQVSDPTTGRTYFTRNAQRAPYSGAVIFTDGKTGELLTLQNTQLKQISREEYNRAVGK